ncbi:MAG: M23 family metallopeptidase [Muribaculaceae bacterium]|nr:M23 family metallopeptidase [Muribaculaceae bacterium]MCM1479907.1 M23 family metallopeptidase [Muribaculaceae bacterium]
MSNSKFKKISGKGLAITGACVVAVAAAGVYSYSKLSDRLNAQLIGENSGTLSANPDVLTEEQQSPVNAPKTDVAKTETTAVTTEPPAAADTQNIAEPTEKVPEETTSPPVTETFIPQAMVRPLNGEILNEFSDGELVKSKTLNVWKTHDGVDIAGATDEKVKSMTSGTVTKVYDDQMLGTCVVVDHGGGLEGYYCNLSKDIPVAEGQSVSAGTIIGSVGNTAEGEISEDSHLHFAVKKNGGWIDPIALISGEGS